MTDDALDKYSTPGLRRNVLTRDEKKNQLAVLKITGEAAKKILDDLYGVEPDDRG